MMKLLFCRLLGISKQLVLSLLFILLVFIGKIHATEENPVKIDCSLSSKALANKIFELGKEYYRQQKYAEADLVLRYWYMLSSPYREWTEQAIGILTNDDFYEYYASTKLIPDLEVAKHIPDGMLFDMEGFRRKYWKENTKIDYKKSYLQRDDIWDLEGYDMNGKYYLHIVFIQRRVKKWDQRWENNNARADGGSWNTKGGQVESVKESKE